MCGVCKTKKKKGTCQGLWTNTRNIILNFISILLIFIFALLVLRKRQKLTFCCIEKFLAVLHYSYGIQAEALFIQVLLALRIGICARFYLQIIEMVYFIYM